MRVHPEAVTVPVEGVAVILVVQLSVAVAVPRAASIVAADGLQAVIFKVVPVAVITGATVSTVQVTVLEAEEALPQLSVAVQVRVCVRVHPEAVTVPVEGTAVMFAVQLSVAVAVPRAESMPAGEGLHPSVSVVPVAVITGATVSTVQVTVLEAEAELPQLSAAVQVRA